MRLEAEITNQALAEIEPCDHPLGALYLSDGPAARALERVRRHYEVAQRAWLTAFKQLQTIRQQQAEDALVMALHAPIPMPEIGFVPQTARSAPPIPSPQSPAPGPYFGKTIGRAVSEVNMHRALWPQRSTTTVLWSFAPYFDTT